MERTSWPARPGGRSPCPRTALPCSEGARPSPPAGGSASAVCAVTNPEHAGPGQPTLSPCCSLASPHEEGPVCNGPGFPLLLTLSLACFEFFIV